MPSRPALGRATAALCALLALTSCQGSPEAGHPNTTPASTSPSPTPTPTGAAASPTWTAQQQAAITAVQARYTAARAAIDAALNSPSTATRTKLQEAGVGGGWIIQVLGDVKFNQDRGWYQAGKVGIVSTSVASVRLDTQQPQVSLSVCLDTSKTSLRYQATGKPVPVGPGNGDRHKALASLVYAPPAGQSKKMWFLIDEKDAGSC
jgi:hypothetical protein